MNKIFTVAVEFTYDCYMKSFLGFRYKFICKETVHYWETPIFTTSEEKAISIFKERYNVEKCKLDLWDEKAKDIVKEVVCIDKEYSIEDLQRKMDSTDFLHYCSQELGLQQTINMVTSK